MNRVGAGGQGESVWDAWFLLACLRRFAELAEARGDAGLALDCREQAGRRSGLRDALVKQGKIKYHKQALDNLLASYRAG